MSYHPEPDSHIKSKIKPGLDLSNYATKSGIKKRQVLICQNLLKWLIQLVYNQMFINQILVKIVPLSFGKISKVVDNDVVNLLQQSILLILMNQLKTDYNAKIPNHSKYINTNGFDELKKDILDLNNQIQQLKMILQTLKEN